MSLDKTVTSSINQVTEMPSHDTMNASSIKAPEANTSELNTGPDVFASIAMPFNGSISHATQKWAISVGDAGLLSQPCSDAVYCENNTLAKYQNVLRDTRNKSGIELLSAVNKIVNRSLNYRQENTLRSANEDHWQTFQETIDLGSGDCEDFAIVKYAILMRAGVPRQNMYVTVLRDHRRGLFHAVLMVMDGGRSFVLDNQIDVVWTDEMLPHYEPLYSLNDKNVWLHGKRIANLYK